MQVLSEYKQQVLNYFRTRATDDQHFRFPLGLSLSSKNQTEVHPGEIVYALLFPLHNSTFALFGSIVELESCDHLCVQYYCFEK